MTNLKLEHIQVEQLKKALEYLNRSSPKDISFDSEKKTLTPSSGKFNKEHLVSLGRFYGRQLFRTNVKLILLQHQPCHLPIDENHDVEVKTDWNTEIQISALVTQLSGSFMLSAFYELLSLESKTILHEKVPQFYVKQPLPPFHQDTNYLYQILDNTLVLIQENIDSFIISDLWKIEWHEV